MTTHGKLTALAGQVDGTSPTQAATFQGSGGALGPQPPAPSFLPLLGALPFLLTQHLPLPLQVFPQLFRLTQVALCGLLFPLLQLSLMQAPESPHLLLVLGN